MDERDERLLTPAEVQALLGLKPKALIRRADIAQLPVIRTLGGHRRYAETPVMRMARRAGRRP